MKKEKLFALLTSIGVYLALVTIVGYIFLSKDEIKKSPHYVVKNSKILEVSLGTPNTKSNLLNSNKKRGVKKKQQKRKKVKKRVKKRRVKKVRNISSKKVAKRVKRAKKVTKKVKKKKIDKKSLFKSVNLDNKKASLKKGSIGSKRGSLGKKNSKKSLDKGVVNRYFANVERMLKGWPAQGNFAGERVDVELTIYKNGFFDFKILKHSNNEEFNRALENYLKELQKIGFGAHNNDRPFKIKVDFIAK